MMGARLSGPVTIALFGLALAARVRFENRVLVADRTVDVSHCVPRCSSPCCSPARRPISRRRAAGHTAPDPLIPQVRTALGRGRVADARRAVETAAGGGHRAGVRHRAHRDLRRQGRRGPDAAAAAGRSREQPRRRPGAGADPHAHGQARGCGTDARAARGGAHLQRSRRLLPAGAGGAAGRRVPAGERRVHGDRERQARRRADGVWRSLPRQARLRRGGDELPAGAGGGSRLDCARISACRARCSKRIRRRPATSSRPRGSSRPSHPDVWLLTAERALFEDDIAAAKAALDKVGAVPARDHRGSRAPRRDRLHRGPDVRHGRRHRESGGDRSAVGARLARARRGRRRSSTASTMPSEFAKKAVDARPDRSARARGARAVPAADRRRGARAHGARDRVQARSHRTS